MVNSIMSNSYANSYLANQSKPNSTVYVSNPGLLVGNKVELTKDYYEAHKDEMIAFNPYSKGGNQLTSEEKQSLSEKYDVTNMTNKQQMQLLGQLTISGAVSFHDFMKAIAKHTNSIVMPQMPAPGLNITSTVYNYKTYDMGKNYNWVNEYTNEPKLK